MEQDTYSSFPLVSRIFWFFFFEESRSVMIKRDSWGHSYFDVRGEILGFSKDELLRKHLSKMFSLIKNES